MKAKFVFEDLNFERGGDPLDRLDIGRIEERRQKILEDVAKSLGFEVESYEICRRDDGELKMKLYKNNIDLVFLVELIYKDGYRNDFGSTLNHTTIFWEMPEFTNNISNSTLANSLRLRLEEYLSKEKESILESQNFERGGNPLDRLDIGLVQKRKLEKMFRAMQGIAMEYDVDINEVILDEKFLFVSVEVSGRRYYIGLSENFINGTPAYPTQSDTHEYSCAYQDLNSHDFSNDTFDTEYDTVEEAAQWIRNEIDNYADNYMNEQYKN